MNTIKIEKRNSEEVACWKVEADKLTPNTVIENSANLTLLVRVDGVSKVSAASSFTLHSLYNPGKKTKLFGGDKAYKAAEIIAIDQSSEFFAEWGLAGNNAIPSFDRDNDVDCMVVAYGEYFYKIEDYFHFFQTMSFDAKGEITRERIREYLRGEATGVIKSYLTSALGKADLKVCQGKISQYNEDVKRQINQHLETKGLTVYNFVINNLTYDRNHSARREILNDAKFGVKLTKITNEGRMDNAGVDKVYADMEIDKIKAIGEANRKMSSDAPKKDEEFVCFCSRCGTRNENAHYCKKCGEKLAR